MVPSPRVAFFPDSFHEVNGVAHTSRNFQAYAERHQLPFLCVRAGTANSSVAEVHGSVEVLELDRSALAIGLEHDLHYDLLFWRHAGLVAKALDRFRPDLIHITGPSELGLLGAYFSRKLDIPLVAAWQTNLHEYIPMRLARFTRLLPGGSGAAADRGLERQSLKLILNLYRPAKIVFAPNQELCDWLKSVLALPCHLMNRGVDTDLFSPERRKRPEQAGLVLGYVGRLSLEKNVGVLPGIAKQLEQAGFANTRFVIVGQGAEEAYLRTDLERAEFAGVLRGEKLAEAYADMDILLFPSHTDTFGNVVLEALASGIPAIVSAHGGPKHIVRHGETGMVVPAVYEPASRGEATLFAEAIAAIAHDPERLKQMGIAARSYALGCTWDSIFDGVYGAYQQTLPEFSVTRPS